MIITTNIIFIGMTLIRPDWLVNFSNICEPDYNPIQILNDVKQLNELFTKETQLTENHINKIIDKPVCNIKKLFALISQRSNDIPENVTERDIYTYFCNNIFVKNIDIWSTVLSPSNQPPERIIFTIITRLELSKQQFKPELEAMRYSLLYCVIMFHCTNINFMMEYVDVLKKSMIYKHPVADDKLLRDYVNSLHKNARDMLNSHNKICNNDIKNIDYQKLYDDIVCIYKNICTMEKMIFYIMSNNIFCGHHILGSLFNFDKYAYNKHPVQHGICICKNMQVKVNLSGHYLSELQKVTNAVQISLDNKSICHAIINMSPSC